MFFNNYINISDTKTLLIATILMFVVGYLYSLLVAMSITTIPIGIGCITIIPLILGAFIITPLKLLLLDKFLPGFQINEFWTYMILTVVLSIFSISTEKNKKD